MGIMALWYDNISIDWWQMLLIGMLFMAANICVFMAMWYVRRNVVYEYGYPKRNKKTIKKKTATYSTLDKFLLLRITSGAERKGPLLYINLVCHHICLIALGVSFVGFIGCMITLAHGWAFFLLVISEIAALFITVLIEFVPHLIWLPSERKRYKLK